MKIIVFTVDHLYANLVVKPLLQEYKNNIKLVVISGVILHKTSFINSLKKYLTVSGWYYFLTQSIKLEIYKLLSKLSRNPKSKFYSFKNILSGVSFLHEPDVNNPNFIKLVKNHRPDLIVSVFFNQILSPKLIEIAKKGAVNIHPAYLPNYKGVSPVFWALVNGEKYTGVSIHYINNGIDTGKIISRKKVLIKGTDGEDSLYFRLANEGVGLLAKAINDISKGAVKNTVSNLKGSYFSLPTKKAVQKFKKKGRNFFNLREYIFN